VCNENNNCIYDDRRRRRRRRRHTHARARTCVYHIR